MTYNLSPVGVLRSVDGTGDRAVYGGVWWSVWLATPRSVHNSVDLVVDEGVTEIVGLSVYDAVSRDPNSKPPHANLHLFLAEVQQARLEVRHDSFRS